MVDLVAELHVVADALVAAGVEFALCGGLAVAVHGHVRATRDIDLLVPTPSATPRSRRFGASTYAPGR
jgi:hypothetical protein